MSIFRRGAFLASAGLAVLLVVAAGTYLTLAQNSSHKRVRQDFASHSALAARLTSNVLTSNTPNNVAYAKSTYGGAESTIQTAADAELEGTPGERLVVLNGDGRVLSIDPTSRRSMASIASEPEMVEALSGKLGISNVISSAQGPAIIMAVPFTTSTGARRVWASSITLTQLSMLMNGYLTSSLGIAGGRASLVDASGVVVASSANGAVRTGLRDAARSGAADRASHGTVGPDDYASTPVQETPWRVIFAASTDELFAPLNSTRRVSWQLFGALVLAIAGVLGLAARAIKSSDRLAHERLHDSLTGLPNRALFIKHTEHALSEARVRGSHLAALFIDLDRFKPVNDEHGHAIGDAVLAAVARRLNESVRTGDVVSRFGGDEFVVLCADLSDEQQGLEVAQRIQQALVLPHTYGTVEVSVGCSIGIAFYAGGAPLDAGSLIHHADLAMFQAKQGGRARIETVQPLALVS